MTADQSLAPSINRLRLRAAAERPLAIDLFSGLGGWSVGLAAAGWDIIRFDLEDMCRLLGEPYPEHSSLVIQDVLAIHGSQLRNVGLIVSSSPCQEFSYRAMPWKRAKALGPPELGMKLFEAQFRIQREASEAAGRPVPMVVENVRGAIPWVGRSRWNFGSYHLWGDVPALMPVAGSRLKGGQTASVEGMKSNGAIPHVRDGEPHTRHLTNPAEHVAEGRKVPGFRFDGSGRSFQTASVAKHITRSNLYKMGFNVAAARATKAPANYTRTEDDKRQHIGGCRKAASARIAKIPFALAEWIARCHLPRDAQYQPPTVGSIDRRQLADDIDRALDALETEGKTSE